MEVFLNKLLGIPPLAAQHIFAFFTICVDCARQKARQSGQPLEAEGAVDLRDVDGSGRLTILTQRVVTHDTESGAGSRLQPQTLALAPTPTPTLIPTQTLTLTPTLTLALAPTPTPTQASSLKPHPSPGAESRLVQMEHDGGMSFPCAEAKLEDLSKATTGRRRASLPGFFRSPHLLGGHTY